MGRLNKILQQNLRCLKLASYSARNGEPGLIFFLLLLYFPSVFFFLLWFLLFFLSTPFFLFLTGGANKRKGRDGGNTYIEVPVGTIIKRVKDDKVPFLFHLLLKYLQSL